jgi:hypothetical protein
MKKESVLTLELLHQLSSLTLKTILGISHPFQAYFPCVEFNIQVHDLVIQVLQLSFQGGNLSCELVDCLLQFFNRPGEGLDVSLSLFPSDLFFGQLIFQSGKGLGSQILVSRLDAEYHLGTIKFNENQQVTYQLSPDFLQPVESLTHGSEPGVPRSRHSPLSTHPKKFEL